MCTLFKIVKLVGQESKGKALRESLIFT